ncbi:hypothetical protein [Allokutzneria albata]|uniref:Uncharacterized protein n=1 Tax=Allokutzneria albata TaxID=211114 RepID=A0A1G9S7K4_ALLAB|nr:hypothetical protein [Allokutzneria albata]SDM31446.1 hypothetical protein SAMN04489726_0947 [Allokutzneria albata]
MTQPRFQVTFRDDHVPAAPAGLYELVLDHTVSGGEVGSDSFPTARQNFEIRAPQFTLDGSFVQAVHPVPGASGAFEYVLPHITLRRLILPWERALVVNSPGLPWMALLVFAEGELPEDTKAQGHVRSRTVKELLGTTERGVLVPDIGLDEVPPELHESDCATIDVPGDVFAAVVPGLSELPHLAHVRKVKDWQAARVRGPAREELEVGDFSVVVANRFPRTAGRYAAHLVSLEGFAPYLSTPPSSDATVRMVSLAAWSFEAVPDARGHFSALVRDLAEDPAGLGLRLNPVSQARLGAERLALGYVPVAYGLVSGECTFAWYRGPFTPSVAQTPPKPGEHYEHADEALVYLTDVGVFDVSYASAFTLGRSLALSDPTLSAALTAFRGRARRIVGRALLRAEEPTRSGRAAEASALLSEHPARDRFHALLADGLGSRLHTAITVTAVADNQTRARLRPRRGGVPRPPGVPALRNSVLDKGVLGQQLAEQVEPLVTAADQVRLLGATPLSHLVPDARMLPPESLRFFHVDPSWCSALLDGVLSAGVSTSVDAALNAVLRERISVDEQRLSGMLMRSTLVRGWPGLIVEPFTAGGELLEIVRRQVIGSDVLLCLFAGVPDEVVFREPHQGIHFGLDEDDRIGLRRLVGEVGAPLGQNFPADGEGFGRFLRPVFANGTPELLDVTALVPAMAEALRVADQLDEGEDLSPAALAVQMVNAPQRISFTPEQ